MLCVELCIQQIASLQGQRDGPIARLDRGSQARDEVLLLGSRGEEIVVVDLREGQGGGHEKTGLGHSPARQERTPDEDQLSYDPPQFPDAHAFFLDSLDQNRLVSATTCLSLSSAARERAYAAATRVQSICTAILRRRSSTERT